MSKEEPKPSYYYDGNFKGAMECHPDAEVKIIQTDCNIALDATAFIQCTECHKSRQVNISPILYYQELYKYNKRYVMSIINKKNFF